MLSFKDFFLSKSSEKLLQDWINHDYKNKPLCIYGKNGIGKTSLANLLLKKYKIITLNTDFIKSNKNINDYLDLSLGKKDICMMFNKDFNTYKSLIFDNLDDISKYDKNLFKNCMHWITDNSCSEKFKNNPIIFILSDNNINKKQFNSIINLSLLFELKYSDNIFIKIVKNILHQRKIKLSKKNLDIILKKSDKNLHILQSNLDINIENNYKDFTGEIDNITDKILNDDFDIDNIIMHSYNDYNIISLNLLENLHLFFEENFLKKYIYIYENVCIADNINSIMIKNHNYDLLDYILLQNLVIPIQKIKIYNKNKIENLIYNKYVSKSIYYLSNYNKFTYNNLNISLNDLYYELFLIDKNKTREKDINKSLLDKFIKIYNWVYLSNLTKKKNIININE